MNSTTQPKFGLMDQGWAAADMSDREAIEISLKLVRTGEELGFDSSWIGEHHHVRAEAAFYGRIPASEIFLAYAAAQTQRITLGTGVRILSTTTALRTAEEMSLLTLLSGGRTEFGVGLGSGQHGTKSREEKAAEFRRLLDELLAVFRNDSALQAPPLSPVPPADMGARIWAAARDEATIDHLAHNGINLVVGQAELGQVQADYVHRYRKAGGTGRSRGVRLVFVGETHDEAMARSAAAADLYFQLMGNSGYRKEAVSKGYLPAEIRSREEQLRQISFIVGSPDEVAEQLNDYVAVTGIDQLDAMVRIPRLDLADVERSLHLLQREVRPQLCFAVNTASPPVLSATG